MIQLGSESNIREKHESKERIAVDTLVSSLSISNACTEPLFMIDLYANSTSIIQSNPCLTLCEVL